MEKREGGASFVRPLLPFFPVENSHGTQKEKRGEKPEMGGEFRILSGKLGQIQVQK